MSFETLKLAASISLVKTYTVGLARLSKHFALVGHDAKTLQSTTTTIS